jgi:RNA polymerase sigma factor for flagellar operon FliA
MEEKSLQELIELYCDESSIGLRNAIITKSMPLVRSIIGKINRPNMVLSQYEDIESAALTGLIQALDSYDCSRDIQFNTFAYYRIRGSIIDYLRSIDQLPRKQRKDYGEIQQVTERLSQELGREPTDHEIASRMNIHIDEYHKTLSNVQQRHLLSLDAPVGDEDSQSGYEKEANSDSELPDEKIEQEEQKRLILSKIEDLKERDRMILLLYFYEDMTMGEIAVLMELTEARISQIIGQLIIKLRSELSGKKLNFS